MPFFFFFVFSSFLSALIFCNYLYSCATLLYFQLGPIEWVETYFSPYECPPEWRLCFICHFIFRTDDSRSPVSSFYFKCISQLTDNRGRSSSFFLSFLSFGDRSTLTISYTAEKWARFMWAAASVKPIFVGHFIVPHWVRWWLDLVRPLTWKRQYISTIWCCVEFNDLGRDTI